MTTNMDERKMHEYARDIALIQKKLLGKKSEECKNLYLVMAQSLPCYGYGAFTVQVCDPFLF
jgi:hypothetical protein